jgi:hypothetical protein
MESATAPHESLTVAHGAGNWGKLSPRTFLLNDGTVYDFRHVNDTYWDALRRNLSRAGTPNCAAVVLAAKVLHAANCDLANQIIGKYSVPVDPLLKPISCAHLNIEEILRGVMAANVANVKMTGNGKRTPKVSPKLRLIALSLGLAAAAGSSLRENLAGDEAAYIQTMQTECRAAVFEDEVDVETHANVGIIDSLPMIIVRSQVYGEDSSVWKTPGSVIEWPKLNTVLFEWFLQKKCKIIMIGFIASMRSSTSTHSDPLPTLFLDEHDDTEEHAAFLHVTFVLP